MLQRLQEEKPPEQDLPILRVCWDDLFDFLRKLLKPRTVRAWTALGNLDASVVTDYAKVMEATVPSDFEGSLNEISLYSSRPDTTLWTLVIVEEVQFTGKRIYSSLTLAYGGTVIRTNQKIVLFAKTDGSATDLAGSLTGQLQYLGGN